MKVKMSNSFPGKFKQNKPENPFQSYDLAKNLLEVQKPKTEQITIGRTNFIIFY